jgi:hypothetical protein
VSAPASSAALLLVQQINADLASLNVERLEAADASLHQLQASPMSEQTSELLHVSRELAIRANQFWEMRLAVASCSTGSAELPPDNNNSNRVNVHG